MAIDAPIHTNEANLSRVLNAGLPVLLVLWRRDCPPCNQLAPVLERLAKSYAGKALIARVNVDEETGVARQYSVTHLPALVFVRDGKTVERGVGAAGEPELAAWLEYLARGGTRPPAPAGPSIALQTASAPSGPARPAEPPRPAEPRREPAAAPRADGQPLTLTDATFDATLRGTSLPVLVDFWAEWCGPCKMIAPTVSQLAAEFAGRAVVAKLNVDENPRTPSRFGIQGIPTLLIFKDGQVVDQIVGAQSPQELRQRLARAAG
jgi:thioredoxin 1